MLLSQNACLHSGARKSAQIPKFQTIALVNKGATAELTDRFNEIPGGSNVETGMTAGAGAGAGAAIAAQSSLACTYLVFVCAIIIVPAGIAIGAAAGTVADAADDPMKGLSDDQIWALERQFAAISERRTLSQDIEASLKNRIPPARLADASETDSLLQFRLYDIRFTRSLSGKYELTLKSVMLFKWDRDTPRPSSSHRVYAFTSRSMPIEDWIQDDGETMNQAFDACVAGLVDEMLGDIQFEGM